MYRKGHLPAAAIALAMLSLALAALGQQSIRTPEAPLYQTFQPNPAQTSFVRLGPFSGNADVGVGYSFTDNANTTETDKISLNQVYEQVDLDLAWTLSPFNRIELTLGGQLQENFYSSGTNALNLAILPGSEIRLQAKVGDVVLQAYEQFAITQDPVSDATVAGQTNLNRLTNTIGASAQASLSHVDLELEFDYTYSDDLGGSNGSGSNVPTQEGGDLRNSLHLGSRVGIEAGPTLSYGLEGNASYNTGAGADDINVLSGGVFLRGHLTSLLAVDAAVGILVGSGPGTGGPGYYARLSARHEFSRTFRMLLEAAHDSEFSSGLGVSESNNFFLTAQADLTRRWSVSVRPFLNFGSVITGEIPGSYTQYGIAFDSSYALSKRLSLAVNYRLAKRDGDGQAVTGQSVIGATVIGGSVIGGSPNYTQNFFSVSLTYRF
jgi:predicted porin